MEVIKLYNRYGDDVHLQPINESEYLLVAPEMALRYGPNEDFESTGNCYMVDPAGGPFIAVGDKRILDSSIVITGIIKQEDGFHIKVEKDDISSN